MVPDRDAATEHELNLLVARVGALYTKQQLSPPFNLRAAVRRWQGLTPDEIVELLARHFDACRHLYGCGAGEQHFALVHQAMRQALDTKRIRASPSPTGSGRNVLSAGSSRYPPLAAAFLI